MKKILTSLIFASFIILPSFAMADTGEWYGDNYSYDTGSGWYGDNYSYGSGSWYGDNYTYDTGSWYGDNYSYDTGSGWYGDNYNYQTWNDSVGYYEDNGGYWDDTGYYDDSGYYGGSYGGGCSSGCSAGSTQYVYKTYVVNTNTSKNLDVVCTVSDRTVERGDEVTFSADVTGGTGPYTYRWTGDFTSSSRNTEVEFNRKGTFTGVIKVTDSKGRTATDECDVRVEDDVDDDDFDAVCVASDTTIDEGDRVTFKARVSGGDRPYDYDWSGDVDGDDEEIRVRFDDEGTYKINLKVTDDEGRVARDTCTVRVGDDDDDDRDINVSSGTLSSGTGTFASVDSVYLNQVPYTGPEDVAKGVAFVTSILAFSLAGAMIMKQKMIKNQTSRRIEAFKQANKTKI